MGGTPHADRINAFLRAYAEQILRHCTLGGNTIARAGNKPLLASKLRQLADDGPHAAWAIPSVLRFLNCLPRGDDVIAHAVCDAGTYSQLLRTDIEARIGQLLAARGER